MQKVHESKLVFEVSSTGYKACLTFPVHKNLNILEYSRHISNFPSSYCDSYNQLLSIINRDVINLCFFMTPEIKIKT